MFLNKYKIVVTLLLLSSLLTFCGTPKQVGEPEVYADSNSKGTAVSLSADAGKSHNHPTFVIWQENAEGEIIRTLLLQNIMLLGFSDMLMLAIQLG